MEMGDPRTQEHCFPINIRRDVMSTSARATEDKLMTANIGVPLFLSYSEHKRIGECLEKWLRSFSI